MRRRRRWRTRPESPHRGRPTRRRRRKPPAKPQTRPSSTRYPVTYPRPLRPPAEGWEQSMSLDRIEQTDRRRSGSTRSQAGDQTRAFAVAMAAGESHDRRPRSRDRIHVSKACSHRPRDGRRGVERQQLGDLVWMLDAGDARRVPPAERKRSRTRAKAIAADDQRPSGRRCGVRADSSAARRPPRSQAAAESGRRWLPSRARRRCTPPRS